MVMKCISWKAWCFGVFFVYKASCLLLGVRFGDIDPGVREAFEQYTLCVVSRDPSSAF